MSRFRQTISDSAAAAGLGLGISPLIVAQVALLPELLSLLVQEHLLVSEEEARRINRRDGPTPQPFSRLRLGTPGQGRPE